MACVVDVPSAAVMVMEAMPLLASAPIIETPAETPTEDDIELAAVDRPAIDVAAVRPSAAMHQAPEVLLPAKSEQTVAPSDDTNAPATTVPPALVPTMSLVVPTPSAWIMVTDVTVLGSRVPPVDAPAAATNAVAAVLAPAMSDGALTPSAVTNTPTCGTASESDP
jgi:hypothetical protein